VWKCFLEIGLWCRSVMALAHKCLENVRGWEGTTRLCVRLAGTDDSHDVLFEWNHRRWTIQVQSDDHRRQIDTPNSISIRGPTK
jgi:hypothetical protein